MCGRCGQPVVTDDNVEVDCVLSSQFIANTIKSVLNINKVLEDALERVGCEGRDWSAWSAWRWSGVLVGCFGFFFGFFCRVGGEADEQHCLAGDFELHVFRFLRLLAGALAQACFLVRLALPDCTAMLASVMISNVFFKRTSHVCFEPGVLYK